MAFTEDLAEDGFFIQTVNVMAPNTKVAVELAPPGRELITLEGTVRWTKKVPPLLVRKVKGGIGIRITRFTSGEHVYREICEELRNR